MINNLFLSVGAMKAGTTWLYEQLKDHPDIHFTPEKEIHYFANIAGIENQLSHKGRVEKLKDTLTKYHKGNLRYIARKSEEIAWYSEFARPNKIDNGWYRDLFKFNLNKKFCADFSNLYCQIGHDGWGNVRKVAKNVKVIYTLRDPLDRLWSHYKFHMKWVSREDEALEAGFQNFKDLLGQHFFWVNAEYAKNYELLRQSLSDNELMILYFEDFRVKPVEMLHEVQDFLGIQEITPDEEKLNKKVNRTKSFEMPDDWREYSLGKLSSAIVDMKKHSLIHPKWNF